MGGQVQPDVPGCVQVRAEKANRNGGDHLRQDQEQLDAIWPGPLAWVRYSISRRDLVKPGGCPTLTCTCPINLSCPNLADRAPSVC